MGFKLAQLFVSIEAQTKGFDAALARARKDLADTGDSAARRVELPSPAAGPGPDGAAGGAAAASGQADAMAAALLPLGLKIQQAIAGAMAPLNQFAARFEAQFEAVGATVIAISRRIDDHIKFPVAEKALEKLRASAAAKFVDVAGNATRLGRRIDSALGGVQWLHKTRNALSHLGSAVKDSFAQVGKVKISGPNFNSSTKSTYNLGAAATAATGKFRQMGAEVALALGAFGLIYKAVGFLKEGIRSATALNETISKVGEVFGPAAETVKAQAHALAKEYGFVRGEVLNGSAAFGQLGYAAGQTSDQMAELARSMTKAAANLTSFEDVGMAEALEKIRSGLSGEAEPLRRFGVLLSEGAVEARALANGAKKVGGSVSEGAKVMARSQLIIRGLKKSEDDLARTHDSTANQTRKLAGTITNLGTDIGTALAPATKMAVTLMNGLAGRITSAFEANRPAVEGFARAIAAGFGRVAALADHLLPPIRAIGATLRGAFSGAADLVGPAIPAFARFAEAARSALDGVSAAVGGLVAAIKQIPGWIEATFGKGSTSRILQFAAGMAVAAVAVKTLTVAISIAGAVGSGVLGLLTSPLLLVPAAIAAATAAIGYFTGAFTDLRGFVDLASYGFRNFGALARIALLQVTTAFDNLRAMIATIPASLAIIADYVRGNWVQLIWGGVTALAGAVVGRITGMIQEAWWIISGGAALIGKVLWAIPGLLLAAVVGAARMIWGAFTAVTQAIGSRVGKLLANLAINFKDFGAAIWAFLKNPTKGFKFDWTDLLDSYQIAADKFPGMTKAALKDAAGQAKGLWDGIAKDEEAFRNKVAEPFALPPGPDAGPDAGGGPAGGKNQGPLAQDARKGHDKGDVSDLAAFASKLQEAASGKKALEERGVKAQERTAKATEGLLTLRVPQNPGMAVGPAWGAAGLA